MGSIPVSSFVMIKLLKKKIEVYFRPFNILKNWKKIKRLKMKCSRITSDSLCECPEDFNAYFDKLIKRKQIQLNQILYGQNY